MIEIALSILKGVVFFIIGKLALDYYKGNVNYSGEREIRRRNRVEKFGFILIICSYILLAYGTLTISLNVIKILIEN